MSNRFELNPKKIFDTKARIAYGEARRRLEGGALCDDCKEVGSKQRAVSFVVHEGAQPDEFFVSFLCTRHADILLTKTRGVLINGRRWN